MSAVGRDPQPAAVTTTAAGATTAAGTQTRWERLTRWASAATLRPLVIYAASRVLVLVVAIIATVGKNAAGKDPGKGPWPTLPGSNYSLLKTLGRWDGAWYIQLANIGYPSVGNPKPGHYPKPYAFFPMLPALIRFASRLTGLSTLTTGVLIGTASGAAAAVVAWHLVKTFADGAAADRAVALLCFFPSAFIFSMPYAEGIIITGVAGALLAAHKRKWVLAGVLGSMATAARPNAAVIVVALAVAALIAIHQRREWRSLAAPVLASAGIITGFAYLWWRTGNPKAWFTSEHLGWHDQVDGGITTMSRFVQYLMVPHFSLRSTGMLDLANFIGVAFCITAAVLILTKWRPPWPVIVYGIGAASLAFSSQRVGLRPRLVIGAFPLILAVGVCTRGKAFKLVLAGSTVLLVLFATVTFINVSAAP